jgi:GNAT superfamily N-acetyltransferase
VESYGTVNVRRAANADATDAARTLAAVAEEDSIATQPPVDVEQRAQRFREIIDRGDPAGVWILEDDEGRQVGHIAVEESVGGVLSIGMAIVVEARGKGGGRALLAAVQDHARAVGAHKSHSRCGLTTHGPSGYTPRPVSRWRDFAAITTAGATVRCAAR